MILFLLLCIAIDRIISIALRLKIIVNRITVIKINILKVLLIVFADITLASEMHPHLVPSRSLKLRLQDRK